MRCHIWDAHQVNDIDELKHRPAKVWLARDKVPSTTQWMSGTNASGRVFAQDLKHFVNGDKKNVKTLTFLDTQSSSIQVVDYYTFSSLCAVAVQGQDTLGLQGHPFC